MLRLSPAVLGFLMFSGRLTGDPDSDLSPLIQSLVVAGALL